MVNPFGQNAPYGGAGWVDTGQTLIEHDNFNQRVDLSSKRNGNNDAVARDLTDVSALGIPISDTNWRLRLGLNWAFFNSFRNTGNLFSNGNTLDIGLSDVDQTFNTSNASQKFIGMRITNFNGNSPTFGIRSGGSPVPPNGFRGLMGILIKDGGAFSGSSSFTPGGQPGSQSITHIEIERNGALVVMTLFTDATFTTMIEQKMVAIPPAVIGLKFLKFNNFVFLGDKFALIDGNLNFYEILSGQSFTPIMPIFPSGLAAKIYNDLGANGPSTGDEVFARIFEVPPDPETWIRIREKHMFGFLENNLLIQRDIDTREWNTTTWSVI